MRLRFRWPFYLGPKIPAGVKCLTCFDQGEYMVMRPGMFVPCKECNPKRVAELRAELEAVTTTTTSGLPFVFAEKAETQFQSRTNLDLEANERMRSQKFPE